MLFQVYVHPKPKPTPRKKAKPIKRSKVYNPSNPLLWLSSFHILLEAPSSSRYASHLAPITRLALKARKPSPRINKSISPRLVKVVKRSSTVIRVHESITMICASIRRAVPRQPHSTMKQMKCDLLSDTAKDTMVWDE
jgi:hypothetical protein